MPVRAGEVRDQRIRLLGRIEFAGERFEQAVGEDHRTDDFARVGLYRQHGLHETLVYFRLRKIERSDSLFDAFEADEELGREGDFTGRVRPGDSHQFRKLRSQRSIIVPAAGDQPRIAFGVIPRNESWWGDV